MWLIKEMWCDPERSRHNSYKRCSPEKKIKQLLLESKRRHKKYTRSLLYSRGFFFIFALNFTNI